MSSLTMAHDAPVQGAVLSMENVSKTFPGQVALRNVSLSVAPGRVHALLGQNGSGKSTLIKILAGYHRADPGGRAMLLGSDLDLTGTPNVHRVHVMHQDLGLVGSLNSVENLALGRGFHTTRTGRVRWKDELQSARKLLGSLDAQFDPRTPVALLSPSERALVALARALQEWDEEGGLLILDEPTAAMTKPEVAQLFSAVRRLADRGAGVIFVSHRLDEVFQIADDFTVLRDGRVMGSGAVADLDHDRLIELIVGRELAQLEHVAHEFDSDSVLEVRNLWGNRLECFDLTVKKGEVVGIAGLVGSGRDELAMLLFGANERASGSVAIAGNEVPSDPQRSIEMGMALVPSERKRYGSIGSHSISANITLARLRPLFLRGRLSRRRERADVVDWVARVGLQPAVPDRAFETLSGGNQQKGVIARWLRTAPKVLILDEPTQGVDVGAKSLIYELLADAAAEGLAVVVCSSETEELAAVCDRVIVLSNGRISAELHGSALSPETIAEHVLR
jgi:ribose transport system ATP-binding protein